jgi:nucleotide-binding universal stress UspA family protein
MAKPHPGNFLVPLGKVISEKERRLLFIAGLANSFHARVTLFHLPKESESVGMPEDISLFSKELQQQGITTIERIGRGDIGRAITVEAINRHNDLIVLGSSGRGVLRSLLFGNPAGKIMHQPPCNAILFRPALSESL